VNRTAFDSKFHTTCWSRSASPRTAPTSVSSTIWSRTPFASAAGRTMSTAFSMTGATMTGRTSRRIFPATMRDTSRRSSMSCAWLRAQRSTTSSPWTSLSAPRVGCLRSRVQVRIGESGVRSSCETGGEERILGAAHCFGLLARVSLRGHGELGLGSRPLRDGKQLRPLGLCPRPIRHVPQDDRVELLAADLDL
jgi:hypothetical protein